MEGTPMLSIIVGDEDRSDLNLDLDAIVREGARRMLMTALRAEVDEYIGAHSGERDATDNALIVRNGVARPRKVTTAAGELEIQAPRVNDRRQGVRFTSAILPPWARRSPKVTEVLPCSTCAASRARTSCPPWPSSSAARRGFRPRPSSA